MRNFGKNLFVKCNQHQWQRQPWTEIDHPGLPKRIFVRHPIRNELDAVSQIPAADRVKQKEKRNPRTAEKIKQHGRQSLEQPKTTNQSADDKKGMQMKEWQHGPQKGPGFFLPTRQTLRSF